MVYKRLCRIVAVSVTALLLVASLTTSVSAGAANYNCGAYGAGAYQSNCVAEASDEALADTGQPLAAFIIPAVLILAGVLLLWRTRRKKDKKHRARSRS